MRLLFNFALGLKAFGHYAEAACYFEKFLNSGQGQAEENIKAAFNLGLCYREVKDNASSLAAFLRSFKFDAPRSEVLSEIGRHYEMLKDYKRAIKWFLAAYNAQKPAAAQFNQNDGYYYFIPAIELCHCFKKTGDATRAARFNEAAARFKPRSAAVAANRKYFKCLEASKLPLISKG